MPAVVVAVLVEPGQRVTAGEPAVVVSAMKMESSLEIPRAGTVRAVHCKVGDKVSPGDVLVLVDPDTDSEEGA
jgi:biotin carboxyl carrier protein